jgi:class 3 adenylate cyclase
LLKPDSIVILLVGVSISILLLLFGFEFIQRMDQSEKNLLGKVERECRTLLAELQQSGSSRAALRELLLKFLADSSAISKSAGKLPEAVLNSRIGLLYERDIKQWLPPHELSFIPDSDFQGGKGFHVTQGWGFSPDLSTEILLYYKRELDVGSKGFFAAGEKLLETTGIPLLFAKRGGRNFLSLTGGRLRVFLRFDRTKGIFFAGEPEHGGVLGAVLDLEELSETIGREYMLKRHASSEYGFGFLNTGEQKKYFSSSLSLSEAEAGRLLAGVSGTGRIVLSENPTFSEIIYGEDFSGGGWTAFVLVPRVSVDFGWLGLWQLILIVIPAAFAFAFLIVRFQMLKPTVGTVLLGSFVAFSFIPITGIHFLISSLKVDHLRTLVQQRTQGLFSELERIDNTSRILHSTITFNARKGSSNPEIAGSLKSEVESEKSEKAIGQLLEFAGGLRPFPLQRSPEFVIAQDQMGFTAMAHQDPDNTFTKTQLETVSMAIRRLNLRGLERANPTLKKTPGLSGPDGKAGFQEDLESEAIDNIFFTVFSRDSILELVSFVGQTRLFQFNGIDMIMMITPLFEGPAEKAHAAAFWLWNHDLERIYAKWMITLSDPPQPSGFESGSVYSVFVRSLSELAVMMGISRGEAAFSSGVEGWYASLVGQFDNWFSKSPGFVQTEALEKAVEQAILSGRRIVHIDTEHPQKPLSVSSRGRHMNQVVLGRSESTAWMDRRAEFMQWMVVLFSFGALVFAVSVSWFGRERITEPLAQLMDGISKVQQENYDSRIPVDSSDEFGVLANSFNTMTKALQEGKILQSFVSDAAIKASERQTSHGSVTRGEKREVTIVFSMMPDFNPAPREDQVQGEFERMQSHLLAFNESVFQYGGYIDKVLEDKLLIVFDHDVMGGAEKAVAAAMSVVRRSREFLSTRDIKITVGINTGEVIAGILGSTKVKMDYTVIGDTVNLASRLAYLAHTLEGNRVVISDSSYKHALEKQSFTRLPFSAIRGKTQKVVAYQIAG